jgi:hypothetical protein
MTRYTSAYASDSREAKREFQQMVKARRVSSADLAVDARSIVVLLREKQG